MKQFRGSHNLMKIHQIDDIKKFSHYLTTDRVVRYYNWKPRTLVRIYRIFGAQKEPEIGYRVVVNAQ